ncbi:MAG: hypothetical protein JWM34_2737 [Ilumatobacteraceae bacterium]|nr:hypothetical protein [Ilumatobacteraceae bacterium]
MSDAFAAVDRAPAEPGWRPTAAHVRCSVAAIVMALVAVLVRRPDLLVLGAPLAIVAGWSSLGRPGRTPSVTHRLADPVVREGQATTWSADFDGPAEADSIVAVMPEARWIETYTARGADPTTGVVAAAVVDGHAVVSMTVRSIRWGQHRVERATIVASSAWGAFTWVHRTPQSPLISLPLPATFDSSATIRRSNGLVGLDRSSRPGDGLEFAGIRPFQAGDRMRRINWARSLRAGSLHVTSTWADQDTLVVLEVDATDDVGGSEGVDGQASSLDLAVRAAGAIAEHHVQRGDRVMLRIIGSSGSKSVPAATGRAHLRRILDTLAAVRAGSDPRGLQSRGRLAVPADSLVILLTPLVTRAPLDRAVALARRGVTVAVVDTLPDHVTEDDDPVTALAWRIRLLERRREVRIAEQAGVAVVPWRGPGSLDQFLRDVARRASAPRLSSR